MRRSTNGRRDADDEPVFGTARPIPKPGTTAEAEARLRQLRGLAWLLDRSIPIGPWRIGLDPIIGLIPGAGDWIGALLSLYVLYQGGRLGMPRHVLTRMAGNILVETIVGSVPVVGDVFDAAWQANARNLKLIEANYRPDRPPRSPRGIGLVILGFGLLVLVLLAGLLFLVFKGIEALFT